MYNLLFVENSLSTNTASSSGDPYITTFKGVTYKLPNVNRIYRCIDTVINGKRLVMNCSVSQLKTNEREDLREYAKKYLLPGQIVLDDGYFYDSFYIKYDDKYIVFNRNIDMIDTNLSSLTNDILNVTFNNTVRNFYCRIQGRAEYISTTIKIDKFYIDLLKIFHPQIINGIELKGSIDAHVNGIFIDNINPKEFKVKKLDCIKEIIPSSNKSYQYRRNETWTKLDTRTNKIVNV